MILSNIWDKSYGRELFREINQLIEEKDSRLSNGIILELYEPEITEFKL